MTREEMPRSHCVSEEHRPLHRRDEINGERTRFAPGAERAELRLRPIDVYGEEPRARFGQRSIGTELLELLAQASVWAPELYHTVS